MCMPSPPFCNQLIALRIQNTDSGSVGTSLNRESAQLKCTGIRFLKYWSRGVGFQLPNSSLLMISGTPRKHYVYGGQVQRSRHICMFCFATAAAESHLFLKAADYIVGTIACNSNFIYRAQTMPGSFFSGHTGTYGAALTPQL